MQSILEFAEFWLFVCVSKHRMKSFSLCVSEYSVKCFSVYASENSEKCLSVCASKHSECVCLSVWPIIFYPHPIAIICNITLCKFVGRKYLSETNILLYTKCLLKCLYQTKCKPKGWALDAIGAQNVSIHNWQKQIYRFILNQTTHSNLIR